MLKSEMPAETARRTAYRGGAMAMQAQNQALAGGIMAVMAASAAIRGARRFPALLPCSLSPTQCGRSIAFPEQKAFESC
jgi:hypothetical protein